MSLLALRRRLPSPLLVILLAVALVLAGFACACPPDHPLQAQDRPVGMLLVAPVPASAPLGFAVLLEVLPASRGIPSQLSQARLQRFLF